MLKQIDGFWVLVSRKTQRPLAYYKGEGKPSKEWVAKQERRIQAFKYGIDEELIETAYVGNIGMMELMKFHQTANNEQKKKLQDHIKNNRKKEAWNLIQNVTDIKLHKSVQEERKVPHPDILGKVPNGAGNDGTDDLVNTYKKDTPGQNMKLRTFKQYNEDCFEQILEDEQCNIYTYNQIKDLEKFADRLLNKFNVDIEFTKHFGERLSSDRNKPCIKLAELQNFFKKIENHKAEELKRQKSGEFVLLDLQKDLNLPVVIDYKNGEFEVTVKTIMRKKNFLTPNKKIGF